MKIRTEEPNDHDAIEALITAAFEQPDEARLVRMLRESNSHLPELNIVAEDDDGAVVGHILFTRAYIVGDSEETPTLALAPMAVTPDRQRSGIGGALVEEGLERARKMGEASVIVLGHPEYYPRFGFVPASQWGIRCPYAVPNEAFMALELKDRALSHAAGLMRYAPEFDAL